MEYLHYTIFGLLLVLSLTVIVPAYTYRIWKLTIATTELGAFFALATFVIFVVGKIHFTTIFMCLATCSLFLYPSISALFISTSIKAALTSTFGPTEQPIKDKPFSFLHSFYPYSTHGVERKTFTYKTIGTKQLTLDVYMPMQRKGNLPLLISVHGGAWSSGDNRLFENFDRRLAASGFVVAEITYRLAPQHHFPAPVEDVNDALQFLISKPHELPIDTERIFLAGRSAGGQIALIAASKLQYPLIKGVIAFYTPSDMVWGYAFPGNPLILDSRKVLEDYIGGTYEEKKQEYHFSSPAEAVNTEFPPVLFIHGKRDEMVAYGHNGRIMPSLKKYNIKNFLLTLPWGTHGCDYFGFSPGGQLSFYATLHFLNAKTTR